MRNRRRGIECRLFLGGKRIYLAADSFNIIDYLSRRTVMSANRCTAFENRMFHIVRQAVQPCFLIPRAYADSNSDVSHIGVTIFMDQT